MLHDAATLYYRTVPLLFCFSICRYDVRVRTGIPSHCMQQQRPAGCLESVAAASGLAFGSRLLATALSKLSYKHSSFHEIRNKLAAGNHRELDGK